jgi:hypothetical protein
MYKPHFFDKNYTPKLGCSLYVEYYVHSFDSEKLDPLKGGKKKHYSVDDSL